MVTVPAVTPVTVPPETAASALDAAHVPPETPSVSVTGVPVHTVAGPAMLPADGETPIVIIMVVTAVPQELV